MEKSFNYRFYPTPEQESLLRRTLGCVRLVYNKALHKRTQAWYEKQERVGYNQTSSMLTNWKKQEELSFLNEVSCVPLQQGLRHLQTAFTNFFVGRAKYPNFKKKHTGGSAEFTKSAFKWKDRQIYLAKCSEPLPIRWSRQIPMGCELRLVTVRLHPSGRWHISIRFDDLTVKPLRTIDKKIGIDLGISSLLVTSDGDKIANPKHLTQHYRRLRQAQKSLRRKQKGSKNRDKARIKVARIHAQITDTRKDHLHKLTTQLVRENQTIVVEDLAVKNMVKNHKLAQSISDASWGEITRQLEYKCRWYGRNYIEIDRWFPSSKRCSICGHINPAMPLKVREWDCPDCGTHHDRDK
ncbi:transposase [Aphanothece hegewaldii CCALA 016]|uniref:Transposase n=1 Tax=Aphanothece hegewaldii CCALA 016 TaxID=2107694 RepID=A0A2T1LTJ0_9CHRO|nr:RNA-guided endonuclease TnpB family protein [Aphanothece hegewaldii]PSF34221.1 transposase [Aphanothece hegewaldii CCALA 016]